jgi:hypothetical protein
VVGVGVVVAEAMAAVAVAAIVIAEIVAAVGMAAAEVVHAAAGNLVTNQFQALDAPFIRKGELSWLADQALLFKSAKRNSLGKRSRRIRQQSAPSAIRRRTRRGLVIWMMISTTVWLIIPMKKLWRRSTKRYSIPRFSSR